MPVVALEDVERAPHRAFITVLGETPLRALIDARLKHTGPFVVREGGAISGLIRDEELFRCLQMRPEGKDADGALNRAGGRLWAANRPRH